MNPRWKSWSWRKQKTPFGAPALIREAAPRVPILCGAETWRGAEPAARFRSAPAEEPPQIREPDGAASRPKFFDTLSRLLPSKKKQKLDLL
jgi:hypothetical protein